MNWKSLNLALGLVQSALTHCYEWNSLKDLPLLTQPHFSCIWLVHQKISPANWTCAEWIRSHLMPPSSSFGSETYKKYLSKRYIRQEQNYCFWCSRHIVQDNGSFFFLLLFGLNCSKNEKAVLTFWIEIRVCWATLQKEILLSTPHSVEWLYFLRLAIKHPTQTIVYEN